MSEFEDFVDTEGLSPDEELRLRRVHDLLVQAGPPPDLTPALTDPPSSETGGQVLQFPLLPRRRFAASALAAAAVAVAAFAGGYLFGHGKAKPETFAVARSIPMHGIDHSIALIRVGHEDSAGNYQLEMSVTGLPKQHTQAEAYVLWLSKDGKPAEPCGWFRVHGATTTVRFSVPYNLAKSHGWVVTAKTPATQGPGAVVMTTA